MPWELGDGGLGAVLVLRPQHKSTVTAAGVPIGSASSTRNRTPAEPQTVVLFPIPPVAGLRDDRGAGSVLALALLAATLMLLLTLLPLGMALSVRQTVTGAADAAALAAADVASGLLPGFPCAQAERVARANRASLETCEIDGLVATVRVGSAVLGITVTAVATAGPPP